MRSRRLAAAILDSALQICTLYVGWHVWLFFTAKNGTTPAKAIFGLEVRDIRTNERASAQRI